VRRSAKKILKSLSSLDDLNKLIVSLNFQTGVLMFPHDDFVIEPLPSHLSSLHEHRHHHGNDLRRSHGNTHQNSHGNAHQTSSHSSHDNQQYLNDLDTSTHLQTHDNISVATDNHHHDNTGNDLSNKNDLDIDSVKTSNTSRYYNEKSLNESYRVLHNHDKLANEALELKENKSIASHDNKGKTNEDERRHKGKESAHIMYRRSALFKHIPDNYQTSKGECQPKYIVNCL
jgi:hypothetical protein